MCPSMQGATGLQDHDVVHFHMCQGEKNDPGKVAFNARLFGDCFSEVNGETKRQARSFVGLWRRFGFRRSRFLGCNHI